LPCMFFKSLAQKLLTASNNTLKTPGLESMGEVHTVPFSPT
jgi:hypothetical protein